MAKVDPPTPEGTFDGHRLALAHLSDDEFMAVLTSTRPLPDVDDDDPAWEDAENFERAELLLAIADGIGERRLVRAIGPLYERAALGDVFEVLRGLRHGPERAVAPTYGILTGIMRPLSHHARAGTRRWAVQELAILRDPAGLPDLLGAVDDPVAAVRAEACGGLGLMASLLDWAARERLETLSNFDPDDDVRASARDALDRISEGQGSPPEM